MEFENLLVSVTDNILLITLNRENKLNALCKDLIKELDVAIQKLYTEQEIKGAVITGKGNKAFAAGADITEFIGLSKGDAHALSSRGHEVFNKITNAPKPIIAAVNGFALGGGCELAMACHIRIAGENAKFGQPEVNLGIVPGYGGTQRLTHLIGHGRAMELILTGKMINAAEAYRIGLVNQLGHNESLTEMAFEMINLIAGKAPIAIAHSIHCINSAVFSPEEGMAAEIDAFSYCAASSDFQEGAQAFLEKRKANFSGT